MARLQSIRAWLMLLLYSGWAHAEDAVKPLPATRAEYAQLAVGVSGVLGAAFGQYVSPHVSDTAAGADKTFLLGVRVLPRWRPGPRWSFGPGASVVFVGTVGGVPRRWWNFEGEARYYLSAAKEAWIAGSVGLALMFHDRPGYEPYTASSEHVAAHTYVTPGPSAAVGLGRDSKLTRAVAFGPELRALVYGVYSDGEHGGPTYRPQIGCWLGLTLTLQAPSQT